MTDQQDQPAPKLYAVVELFGHQRIAGQISEQNFGGAHFVRVDVPEITVEETRYANGESVKVKRLIEAHTRSFGAGAIYSVNWCDETTALVAVRSIQHEPLRPYSVKSALQGLPEEHRNRLLGFEELEEDETDDVPY